MSDNRGRCGICGNVVNRGHHYGSMEACKRMGTIRAALLDCITALERCKGFDPQHDAAALNARAVIAKAEGKALPCRNCGCSPCAPTCVVADSVGRKK